MVDLHVKYRPENLNDFMGNKPVVQSIKAALKGNCPHAMLFTGPSGCGKTTLARIVGSSLEADMVEVDAASYSGVKDMRELVEPLLYSTMSGNPRLIVIDECHALSSQAWQVLLKPVEEPISTVYFAFCTTEEGKVPKTIKTRTVHYRVEPLDDDSVFDILEYICKEEDGPDEAVIEACVDSAQGSARQAIVNLQACWECSSREQAADICAAGATGKEVVDLCRALYRGNPQDCIKIVGGLPANVNPEGVRIQVMLYMTSVALKDPSRARLVQPIMDAFEHPFNETDKRAPIVLAVLRCFD